MSRVTTADYGRQSSLDLIWSALIRSSSKEVANPAKIPTNPQGTVHIRAHKTEEGDTESGEGVGAAVTTTYGYDALGNRVFQQTGSTTVVYPNQYFSETITTGSGTSTIATSTEFINAPQQNGQNLPVAEIFQTLVNGVATGTPTTYYVHTDNLGSINALSDSSGNLVSYQNYYPYGATNVASSTGLFSSNKGYIGQYSDTSGLSYLNARYYSPAQGQFLTEDPVFLGNPKQQNLQNPQSLNAYSYAEDNPVTQEDPSGLLTQSQNAELNTLKSELLGAQAILNSLQQSASVAAGAAGSNVAGAVQSHPYVAAGVAGVTILGIGAAAFFTWGLSLPFTAPEATVALGTVAAVCEEYCPSGEESVQETTQTATQESSSFFEGTTYNLKTSPGDFHGFPSSVAASEQSGTISELTGGDGATYQKLTIPGSYLSPGQPGVPGTGTWYDGNFEYIKDSSGVITHAFFNPF